MTQRWHRWLNGFRTSLLERLLPVFAAPDTILTQPFGLGLEAVWKPAHGVDVAGMARSTLARIRTIMTLDQLAKVLQHMPDTGSLTLSVPELRGLVADAADTRSAPTNGRSTPTSDLDSGQVLARYGISARQLLRWRKAGRLPGAYLDGAFWRFPPSAIAACDQWRAGHPPPTGPKGRKPRKGRKKKKAEKPTKPKKSPAVDGRELSPEEHAAVTDWREHLNRDATEEDSDEE